MHGDGDGGSPRHCLSGQDQCPGTPVWVAEGAWVRSSSGLLGGIDRQMEGCSTTRSLISWLFETGKPSSENTRAAKFARVGRESRDCAELAAANEKQAESPASPPGPLSPLGVSLYFLKS